MRLVEWRNRTRKVTSMTTKPTPRNPFARAALTRFRTACDAEVAAQARLAAEHRSLLDARAAQLSALAELRALDVPLVFAARAWSTSLGNPAPSVSQLSRLAGQLRKRRSRFRRARAETDGHGLPQPAPTSRLLFPTDHNRLPTGQSSPKEDDVNKLIKRITTTEEVFETEGGDQASVDGLDCDDDAANDNDEVAEDESEPKRRRK